MSREGSIAAETALSQAVRDVFGAYISDGKITAFLLTLEKKGLTIVPKDMLEQLAADRAAKIGP